MPRIRKAEPGSISPPRPLIKAMVQCPQPEPMKTIGDPCCGTGGFFLAAYDFLISHHKLDREQNRFLKNKTFGGNEIVAGTRRLALMNMFLHNIREIDGEPMISNSNALIADPGYRYDYILTNPPFGKKEQHDFHQRRRRAGKGRSLQPPGFLDHYKQQAAKLFAAYPYHPQNWRAGSSGTAGQCIV